MMQRVMEMMMTFTTLVRGLKRGDMEMAKILSWLEDDVVPVDITRLFEDGENVVRIENRGDGR